MGVKLKVRMYILFNTGVEPVKIGVQALWHSPMVLNISAATQSSTLCSGPRAIYQKVLKAVLCVPKRARHKRTNETETLLSRLTP